MGEKKTRVDAEKIPRFNRNFFESENSLTRIGTEAIGGKASGLAFIKDILADHFAGKPFEGITVNIPRMAVITTEFFDYFMERNNLHEIAFSDAEDDRIAHAFQRASLPAELVGDLRGLIASVRTPLAVRSSSRLEDAMYEPFAGVYSTKMIPNNQADIDTRFRKLTEAVKYVYASTFFKSAKEYLKITGKQASDEKMAVIIQEVVGRKFGDLFYPNLSGVARSYNFYPTGKAKPDQGVVDLALGLGKTIVDGGLVWTYSPAFPRLAPVVGSTAELLKVTQTDFWAVNMGRPAEYDPIRETEYMLKGSLEKAEGDGVLKFTASTYRPHDDRLVAGIGPDGPRVLTFAPILCDREIRLNDLIIELLKYCEEAAGCEVEIEFAVTLDHQRGIPARFGFLQVRPMVVSHALVEIADAEMEGEEVLAASDRVMGNGVIETIADIVYVRPEVFESRHTRSIADEIGAFNRQLVNEGRKYLLVGFGRWGSSDPWLGIPVDWSRISGAGVIVEATLPDMDVDLSQGSHFFHNISSFQICYFMIKHSGRFQIDWNWLEAQEEVSGSQFVSHRRLPRALTVKVDGRGGKGVILK
jgi:hypothetical protein